MDDYTFENGSKPTKPDFVDPDYTFENGTKPEWPKVVAKPKSPESPNLKASNL